MLLNMFGKRDNVKPHLMKGQTMKKIVQTIGMIALLSALSLPAAGAEKKPSVPDQGKVRSTEMNLLLNSFGALGEGHIEKVLAGLKKLAITNEARSGKWGKMKNALAEFGQSGIQAAAVWFVRPDGSYYTVEKGLVKENLRDRAYFQRLMAGRDVAGELVISKSTGKRVAVVSTPVEKNGKVIGALGVSVSAEGLSRVLDEKMGLPENMFFYALDPKGRTSLHRVSALLFAYPSDMGSKSLAKTVKEMLAEPEGEVSYDFYGKRTVVFKRFPLTHWVYAVGVITGEPGGPGAELPPILSDLGEELSAKLSEIDQNVAGVARRFSQKKLTRSGKKKMLADLCKAYSFAADCAFVDARGRLALVEPREYAKFEGSDISSQEQVVRLQKTKKPVLSNAFQAVEGFEAVDLEHPVVSPAGAFEGAVSMLIRPDDLFSSLMTPVLRGMPVEAFTMQTNGKILYDEDKDEVGRMVFEDPVYKPFPQLLALAALIAKEPTGAGSYEFKQRGSENLVKKDAHWVTVGLHGTAWRLVVMHVRAGHALSSDGDLAQLETHAGDALRALAESAELKKALSGNDRAQVVKIFREFYSTQEGVYSIEWLDSRGTNRCGYPEENSLIDMDMNTAKTESAKPMLAGLSGKKESTFDCPLVEGKVGTFFMVPVFEGENYLGMIYTITLKK
jgi:HK/GC/Chemotaxis protein-like, sensor domain/Cache domain